MSNIVLLFPECHAFNVSDRCFVAGAGASGEGATTGAAAERVQGVLAPSVGGGVAPEEAEKQRQMVALGPCGPFFGSAGPSLLHVGSCGAVFSLYMICFFAEFCGWSSLSQVASFPGVELGFVQGGRVYHYVPAHGRLVVSNDREFVASDVPVSWSARFSRLGYCMFASDVLLLTRCVFFLQLRRFLRGGVVVMSEAIEAVKQPEPTADVARMFVSLLTARQTKQVCTSPVVMLVAVACSYVL